MGRVSLQAAIQSSQALTLLGVFLLSVSSCRGFTTSLAGSLALRPAASFLPHGARMRTRSHGSPMVSMQMQSDMSDEVADKPNANGGAHSPDSAKEEGGWKFPWTTPSQKEKLVQRALAFAAVAGSGVAAFLVEQGGTVLVLEGLRRYTGASGIVAIFEALTVQANSMGSSSVVAYAAACTLLQVAPVFNGIIMAMGLGLIFGTKKGIAIMSFSAVASSVMCLLNSRYLAKGVLGGGLNSAPQMFKAVAESFGDDDKKALVLVSLVRLSPVIPFVWSNYLFGLTTVPVLPYAAGTFIGTLPGLSVFVSAGVVGKALAEGSVSLPPALLGLGAAATVAVLTILSKVSSAELAKVADNKEGEEGSGGGGGGGGQRED